MNSSNSDLRKFVFVVDGGETIAPNGEEVDNFQVLGFVEGKDIESAKQTLLEENEWILQKGFSMAEIRAYEIIEHSKLVITKKKGKKK